MNTTQLLTVIGSVGGLMHLGMQYAPPSWQHWLGLGLALMTAATGYFAKGVDHEN